MRNHTSETLDRTIATAPPELQNENISMPTPSKSQSQSSAAKRSGSKTSRPSLYNSQSATRSTSSTVSYLPAFMDDNNNISRLSKQTQIQKSTIFEEPSQQVENITGGNQKEKWPWHTRALKSQIVFEAPEKQAPKPKKYPWDQRESWILRENPKANVRKSNCKKWPWQERAAQSQVFANRVNLEKPSGQVHIFPWDQRRSFGIRPLQETDILNNNAILTPANNAATGSISPQNIRVQDAAVNNRGRGGRARPNSNLSRYQMDFKKPALIGQVIMPAGKSSGYVDEDYYQKLVAMRISPGKKESKDTADCSSSSKNVSPKPEIEVRTIIPKKEMEAADSSQVVSVNNDFKVQSSSPRVKQENINAPNISHGYAMQSGKPSFENIPGKVTVKTEPMNLTATKPVEIILLD